MNQNRKQIGIEMKQNETKRNETNDNNDNNNAFYLAVFHSRDSLSLQRKPKNQKLKQTLIAARTA